jgi:glycogen synthase
MMEAMAQNYHLSVPTKVISNGCFRSGHLPAEKIELILTAGRLWDEAKNIQFLERIAPKLKWPIHAAGENRRSPGCQQVMKNIRLLGHLSNLRLAEYLNMAAIYVAPALYEPFGLTVLEAALSGCSLVLSDIPSFRENWDGAALLISTEDPDQWCAVLNRLSEDREFRNNLARKARQRALELRPEEIGTRYFNMYCDLLTVSAQQENDPR